MSQPNRNVGDQEQRKQKQNQNRLNQQQIPKIDGNDGPCVGAQRSQPRRQIVAVLAQKPDRRRLGVRLSVLRFALFYALEPLGPRGPQLLLDNINSIARCLARRQLFIFRPRALDPRSQPVSDVTTSRHGREIVECSHLVEFSQPLEDAQVECRAADAAAGKREARQLHLPGLAHHQGRLIRCILAFLVLAPS